MLTLSLIVGNIVSVFMECQPLQCISDKTLRTPVTIHFCRVQVGTRPDYAEMLSVERACFCPQMSHNAKKIPNEHITKLTLKASV